MDRIAKMFRKGANSRILNILSTPLSPPFLVVMRA